MKKIFLGVIGVLCTLLSATTSYAFELNKSDANIIGHVLDKRSGEHLAFISVSLKGTTMGATTDNSGHYFLKGLPEGEFMLEVSAVGYKTIRRQVSIHKGVTLEENFEIEEDLISLEGVVVSANRSETTRRMAPTLVNVMDSKVFENTNSNTLSQGLKFQPGVRVENSCQNCGFQQVRINGLDGPYTQVLIDSRPIFSALAGVYGLEQIPANMVERVEVMRGGGSALFGSSAIAGTINIITKEPVRNFGQVAHNSTAIGGLSSWDHSTTINASLVTDNHKAGLYVFGQNRERSGYDHDGDGFTELPQIKSQTVGMRSYVKTGLYSKLTFEYHHLEEFRRGGDNLGRPPHEANIAEQIEHTINSGGVKFDNFSANEKQRFSLYASAQHTKRDSYYGGGKDPNAYGATTGLTWIAGSQYIYSFDKLLFMPADFTGGLEYTQDNLDDQMWGYDRYITQKIHVASAFAQNEWKTKEWSFLIGGRLDKHSLLNAPVFSPRANIRFNPNENVNFRASYSYGFRAPQAFDEDFHIENVGGTVGIIRLADDLKQENSQSLSLSADLYHSWGDWQGNFLIEGFYTSLDNVFALRQVGKEDGIIINERYNELGALVHGLTLEGKLAYRSLWQLQGGVTLQQANYKEERQWSDDEEVAKEKRMFRTPNTYGYFTLSYTPSALPLNMSLSGNYTGSMLVPHRAGYIAKDEVVNTPDFFELNFKVGYDINVYGAVKMQINAGVQNIFDAYQNDFDKGSLRDSRYIYGPGSPRSYFAGIKLSY
ncbi:MAG: TonB-dependent receptor [Phocaeicola sp.]